MPGLTLERRIAVVFVGLAVLVMLLILLLVQRSGERIVAVESQRQLAAGQTSFEALVDQNQRQLELAATVLSRDFSFREAIATQDRPTMISVLQNHGLRIGARAMMAVALDGRVIADIQQQQKPGAQFAFAALLAAAGSQGRASDIVRMADGQVYQVVVVPILAPARIAWIVMGFPVDYEWASGLARSSGLDVSLLDSMNARILASSLPETRHAALVQAMAGDMGVPREVTLDGDHYQGVALPLGQQAQVFLLHSLEKSEAVFRELEQALLITASGGIVLLVFGSLWLARHIAGPINALAATARHIEAGDYSQPVAVTSKDEIGQLAASFESMRLGIAAREGKITRLAYEDALTGLPNRVRIEERLANLGTAEACALVVLDLDRFASINDALGHPVGDQLLRQVGVRLSQQLPPRSMLARLWGDEFAFLLEGMERSAVLDFAEVLRVALLTPMEIEGQRLDVNGSLGIAFYPADGADLNALLQRAELAMYEAKRRQSGFMLAEQVGPGPLPEHLSLIGEMRDALDKREFILHYQPKLDLASGRIVGAEALLRWQHPERGLVPPGRFIPFAESTGFIREITPWLLGEVAAQTAAWRAQGLDLVVSANLSARDLLDPGLVVRVRELVVSHDLPPAALCLEITESALMEDPALAQSHLQQLADFGVKLSIDDYGAGQASLAYVKSLPVHELKIDQSFIRSLADSPKDVAIVRSTIALGHALDFAVVAEGIETEADLAWLRENGCDVGQGYFIARPMAAAALGEWLASQA
ncbi:MAG: EAL domain-containing protein [Thiobacillus sp.]|nr:EAL domain-containing protein [Thiobacillus sp.]